MSYVALSALFVCIFLILQLCLLQKCEEIARMLQSLDLNTAKERSAVQGFVIQAISRLSDKDSKLPQVLMVSEMVQRGIGVHHGGLLPILKECVEILFSRNLIKILFATEVSPTKHKNRPRQTQTLSYNLLVSKRRLPWE